MAYRRFAPIGLNKTLCDANSDFSFRHPMQKYSVIHSRDNLRNLANFTIIVQSVSALSDSLFYSQRKLKQKHQLIFWETFDNLEIF
jgi:hypothetical protein